MDTLQNACVAAAIASYSGCELLVLLLRSKLLSALGHRFEYLDLGSIVRVLSTIAIGIDALG